MPVDDLAAARTAIRDRRLSDLLGVPECGWLDVKNGIYELDNPAKSEELAKDVAGFANSPSGGLLLVGFSTRKMHDREIVDKVRPVGRAQVDLDRHRKLIRERVIPPPRGVIVDWIDCGDDSGVLVIDVPAQPSACLPYVVPGPTRAPKPSSVSVAVPIREADATPWLPQAEIQRLLAAGWAAKGGPTNTIPVVVSASADVGTANDGRWRGGSEVSIGDRRYLLHGSLLAEHADPGQSVLWREAMARQIEPLPTTDGGYVWLRQAGHAGATSGAYGNAAVRTAREALARERTLLQQAVGIGAIPRVVQLVSEGGRTTLAVGWPVTKRGEPCRTLGASFRPGVPPDQWRLHLLLTGIRGIAVTLSKLHARGVTHRSLTLDGIIVVEDGRFALRDLGLAGHSPRPGEGPAACQAPEQQPGGGTQRPGPATDLYQLATITYYLATGHLPAPRHPAPARSLNQEVPTAVSDLLAAGLAANPANRPAMSKFGSAHL